MSLSNWEIAVYALFESGGHERLVPTEDVALKCFKMLPKLFSWVKYPEFPDKDIVRVALTDARKEKVGMLVEGRAGRWMGHGTTQTGQAPDGWRLTPAGVDWIKENISRLRTELGVVEHRSTRQERERRLNRIRNHKLFEEFTADPSGFAPSVGIMADMLRCRVDAERAVWTRRLDDARALAVLAADEAIATFIERCRAEYEKQAAKD